MQRAPIPINFATLALAFAGGAWLQLGQSALAGAAFYGGLLCAVALFSITTNLIVAKRYLEITSAYLTVLIINAIYALSALVCGFALAGLHGVTSYTPLAAALEGQDITLSGYVATLPLVGDDGVRFTFDVEPAPGLPQQVPKRLALAWYAPPNPAAITPGSHWRFQVRLRAVHGTLNLHGFDAELQNLERGIQAAGYVRPKGERELVPGAIPWRYTIEALRYRLKQRIRAALGDAPYTGVLQALAVGDQSAIAASDWATFRDSGIGHLMSISGLHVTMFAWLTALLAGWCWRRSTRLMHWMAAPQAARWIGLAVACAYAAIAGWGVPAQRTVVMLFIATLALQGGRRYAWADVLLLALVAVVALDPWALLQPGFWLSFSAVGMLFWASYKGSSEQPAIENSYLNRSKLREAAHSQAVATVALVPLTVLFFQQVSLVSPLANALAIPLVSLVVTPLAVIGLLLPEPLSTAVWTLAHALLGGLQWLLSGLVALPWATVSLPAPDGIALALALLGVVILVAPAIGALRWTGAFMLLPLLLVSPPAPPPGEFTAHIMDVGQGTAVLLSTRNQHLLYDTGASYPGGLDAGARVVLPLLRSLGVRRLHTLVISHADSDHAGGAQSVLSALPVARLLSSITGSATALIQDPARKLAPESCQAGQTWTLDGVRFEMLHPLASDYQTNAKTNAMSCVLKATSASGKSLLLMGDAEAAQEAAMLTRSAHALKVTVLLVGHHGSKTSTSPAFLQAVAPDFAATQVGYRSRYGHPHPSVVARLAEAKVVSLRSDCHGGLLWRSAAPGAWVKARVERWRYWRHTCHDVSLGTNLADKPLDSKSSPLSPDFQDDE